jgi:hypothetical protein
MEFEHLKYLSFFGPIAAAQHDDDDLESTRLIHHNIFEKNHNHQQAAPNATVVTYLTRASNW